MPHEVTVLMAVHNGQPYLRMAIESVLQQTYQAFRFLIVDDASTDDTREVIRSYDDPRIELRCLERNVGQTAALNLGFREASTTWIARMDADDFSDPMRLEEQMRALSADSSLSCVGTFAWTFRDDPQVWEAILERPVDHPLITRELLRMTPLIHGTLILRRLALLDVGGYDEHYRYSADRELYDRLLTKYRAANLPKPLLGIRRHAQQGSFTRVAASENIEIFSRMCASPHRTREALEVLHHSLSYSHLFRAKCWVAEGQYVEAGKDVFRAFRISPRQTLKTFWHTVIPARQQAPRPSVERPTAMVAP